MVAEEVKTTGGGSTRIGPQAIAPEAVEAEGMGGSDSPMEVVWW